MSMFAVIVYFWRSWRQAYFASLRAFQTNGLLVAVATVITNVVGIALLQVIKHLAAGNESGFEIEQLFGYTRLLTGALAAAGILILVSARSSSTAGGELSLRSATWIGAVQGMCLPFRGFSRSGATIFSGLLLGVSRRRAEKFSFALAVVLTPAVIVKEGYRFVQVHSSTGEPLW